MRRKHIPILITIIVCSAFVFAGICYGIFLCDAFSQDISDELVLFDYEVYNDKNTKKISGRPSFIDPLEYDYQTISLVAEKGYVFPSSIVGSFSNDFFFFSEKHDSDSGVVYRAEIYLRVSYSETDFLNEIERVSKLECYGKKPVLVGDLFSLPCLVASYNLFSYFEYALLDYDKNQIYYVYLYDVGSHSQIVFDSQYSPQKKLFDSSFPSDLATSYGAYSMYWSY